MKKSEVSRRKDAAGIYNFKKKELIKKHLMCF